MRPTSRATLDDVVIAGKDLGVRDHAHRQSLEQRPQLLPRVRADVRRELVPQRIRQPVDQRDIPKVIHASPVDSVRLKQPQPVRDKDDQPPTRLAGRARLRARRRGRRCTCSSTSWLSTTSKKSSSKGSDSAGRDLEVGQLAAGLGDLVRRLRQCHTPRRRTGGMRGHTSPRRSQCPESGGPAAARTGRSSPGGGPAQSATRSWDGPA